MQATNLTENPLTYQMIKFGERGKEKNLEKNIPHKVPGSLFPLSPSTFTISVVDHGQFACSKSGPLSSGPCCSNRT